MNLSELFQNLVQPLRNVLHFDYLSVRLHDPPRSESENGTHLRRIRILRAIETAYWDSKEFVVSNLSSTRGIRLEKRKFSRLVEKRERLFPI
jgi:hypothetical protein